MDLFCKRGCFCLPVAAIQALRSVLNAFCVVNRKNMFVYQERSTKSVFYLRFDSLLLLFFSSGSSFVPKVFFSISPPMLKESSQYKLPSISSQYKLSSILRELCEDCCDTALLDFFPSRLLEAKIHPQMFLQQQCGGGEIWLPGNWTAVKQDIARKQFCDVCARWRSFQIAVFTLRLEPAFPLMLADAVPRSLHSETQSVNLLCCV